MGAEDFVKLSVRYRADMALAGVTPVAELAFLRGLAYAGLNGTRGIVAASDLVQLGPRRVAGELVAAGFWEAVPAGWRYRSWDKWQGALDQVETKRARDAERKRLERQRKREELLGGDEDA